MMATRIGDLARHTGIYGIGTIVGGIARVALVPIIARYVPTEEYGKASVVLIFITFMAIVSELGLSSSLIKFVNEADSEGEKRRVVSTVVLASLTLSIPIAVGCLLLVDRLALVLLGSIQYSGLVMVGIVGGFGNAILYVGLSFERALARSTRYVVYTLLKGALALSLSIILVVVLRRGAVGLLVGNAVPPLVIGGAIYGRLIATHAVSFSRRIFKAIFDFGSPLVPMNLAMWVLAYSDIYLLRRLAGSGALAEVGLYQYGHEICLVLVLPITAFNLAWPQFIFSNHYKPGAGEMFSRVHLYLSFFLVGMGFLISVFAEGIIRLVGSSDYAGSAGVIPYLACSLVFYGFSIAFASGLYIKGRTRILASVVGGAALLNIVLNILLIPPMGKRGAALATLTANFVMALVVLRVSQHRYRIPFRLKRSLGPVLLGAALVAAFMLLNIPGTGPHLLLRLAAAGCYIWALLAIVGMGRHDIRTALSTMASIVRPSSHPRNHTL
jgi:O-antigen/teichoic acid export membrane protein